MQFMLRYHQQQRYEEGEPRGSSVQWTKELERLPPVLEQPQEAVLGLAQVRALQTAGSIL